MHEEGGDRELAVAVASTQKTPPSGRAVAPEPLSPHRRDDVNDEAGVGGADSFPDARNSPDKSMGEWEVAGGWPQRRSAVARAATGLTRSAMAGTACRGDRLTSWS
jgi:hypothetical protein